MKTLHGKRLAKDTARGISTASATSILVQIAPTTLAVGDQPLAELQFTWAQTTGAPAAGGGTQKVTITAQVTEEAASISRTNPDVTNLVDRFLIYKYEREAQRAQERGDLEKAKEKLGAATRELHKIGEEELAQDMEQQIAALGQASTDPTRVKRSRQRPDVLRRFRPNLLPLKIETENMTEWQSGIRAFKEGRLREAVDRLRAASKDPPGGLRPAEGTSGLFGGNSNWRGPVWFPINYLILEALERYHHFYGDGLKVECPVGSGRMLNLQEVAWELEARLASLFLPDASGRRPCHGEDARFATDPHWKDLVLFHEYFHGDNGRGVGASHQTGWTALVLRCIEDQARQRGGPAPARARAPGRLAASRR